MTARWDAIRRPPPWLPVLLVALAFYVVGVTVNPPGFYLDEASISYNAYTISVDGRDEHGVGWPVFFQTWDPTAAINPIYVYLLAVVFKVFGPSILAARLFSAVVMFAAAVVLGLVARRITSHPWVPWVVTGTALLTPWLFEVGRLAFEVALYPLVIALLLLVIARVRDEPRWSPAEIVALGVLLGLVAYTYTIGRVLGPLLAVGLVLFWSRDRARSIVATWFVFGVVMLPALAFNLATGALTARADLLGYIRPGMSVIDIGGAFLNHVLGNLDLRRILLLGDPNIRHHVPAMGSLLAATLVLAIAGLDRVAHGGHRDPWIRFVVYGLLVSLIPASLTIDDFHTLRLMVFPVFLLVLVGVGAQRLLDSGRGGRLVLIALAALTVAQGTLFQAQFWQQGPGRGGAFDAAFPGVFEAALATGASPIYLRDQGNLPGYIEAYWYGATLGIDRSAFVRLRSDEVPPPGAVVLGTDKNCGACDVLAEDGDYIAYRAGESSSAGLLPNADFEEIGSTPLESFGAPVFGWSTSDSAALLPDGARSDGAHLVLAHTADTDSTKQATSTTVAVEQSAPMELEAFVRAQPANASTVKATVALVELDADHQFLTWHTTTVELAPGADWRQERIAPIALQAEAAFVNVSCYLEPGGSPGDGAGFDDLVVDYLD